MILYHGSDLEIKRPDITKKQEIIDKYLHFERSIRL